MGLFENFNLFAFRSTEKDKQEKEKELEKRKSFAPPIDDDGSILTAANAFGQLVDLSGTSNIINEGALIGKYREMSLHPEVDAAVSDIVNESIIMEQNKSPVSINLDDVDLSENIKKKIRDEFEEVVRLLNFRKQAYDVFRLWYIDGRIFYHVIVDADKESDGIQELRYLDPRQIKKVKEVERTIDPESGVPLFETKDEFYVFNPSGVFKDHNVKGGGIRIDTDAIASTHSGLFDSSHRMIISHLHKAIKPLNNLRMIEDAQVIYRIARAPERRIFYIDVGSLPKTKAEQYLRSIMTKYKNKLSYDVDSGEIKDNKRRYHTMLEDFWLPRREGNAGTEVTTLPGGQNLSQIEDIEYFQKKLYKSLNVPSSRLESDSGFSLGRAAEISRDELKFSKFISRLRIRFAYLLDSLLEKQLLLKKVVGSAAEWEKIKEKLYYDFESDSQFTELKCAEILRERFSLLRDAMDAVEGGYVSRQYVKDEVLRLTEEEQNKIEKEIKSEEGEREEFPNPNSDNSDGVNPDDIDTDTFDGGKEQ